MVKNGRRKGNSNICSDHVELDMVPKIFAQLYYISKSQIWSKLSTISFSYFKKNLLVSEDILHINFS